MKNGFFTTEFWAVVAVVVTSLIGVLNDLIQAGTVSPESKWVGLAGAILAGVYTVARTLLKAEEIKKGIKVLFMGGLLVFSVSCTATQLVDQVVEANDLRHTNAVVIIGGMRKLVDGSPGEYEAKLEMLNQLDLALRTENALHVAMSAFLRAEKDALDALVRVIEQIKGSIDAK